MSEIDNDDLEIIKRLLLRYAEHMSAADRRDALDVLAALES